MEFDTRNKILDAAKINRKIKRIAYEIFENNYKEQVVFVAGINGSGFTLATRIAEELKIISNFEVHLFEVKINKSNPFESDVSFGGSPEELTNNILILVDDVLNTGRTFSQSLKPFLKARLKKIETVVLVNRSHKHFPISANYTGYELSTSINEHIEVKLDEEDQSVYLY